MSLVFLQALLGDFAHLAHVEHAYCPDHGALTHDVGHVEAVRLVGAGPIGPRHGVAYPLPEPGKTDHSDSPFECDELVWIGTAPLTLANGPPTAPPLPPVAALDVLPIGAETRAHAPLPLHFHASGLSPPPAPHRVLVLPA